MPTHPVGSVNRKAYMTQPTPHQPKRRSFNTMRVKGLALCALGFCMLSMPLVIGDSPVLMAYASALRPAGWFSLVAGMLLLGLHHFKQSKRSKVPASPEVHPQSETPDPDAPPTLRDIREKLQREKRQSERLGGADDQP